MFPKATISTQIQNSFSFLEQLCIIIVLVRAFEIVVAWAPGALVVGYGLTETYQIVCWVSNPDYATFLSKTLVSVLFQQTLYIPCRRLTTKNPLWDITYTCLESPNTCVFPVGFWNWKTLRKQSCLETPTIFAIFPLRRFQIKKPLFGSSNHLCYIFKRDFQLEKTLEI